MAWGNIHRQPHKVELDGNNFYVRALTRKELGKIDALSNDDDFARDNEILRSGVCDERGKAILDENDTTEDIPVSVSIGLIRAILDLTYPEKKVPLNTSTESCGESQQAEQAADSQNGNSKKS